MNSYSSLSCPICYRAFNLTDRTARILPTCGHTICTACVKTMSKGNKCLCPFDNKAFYYIQNVHDAPPVNFYLQQLVEEKLRDAFCIFHQTEKADFVCLTDSQRMCTKCMQMTNHQEHQVKEVKELQATIDQCIKEAERSKDHYERMHQSLKKVEEELLNMVDFEAKELQKYIENKKMNLWEEVREWMRVQNNDLKNLQEKFQFEKKIDALERVKKDVEENKLNGVNFDVLFSFDTEIQAFITENFFTKVRDQAEKGKKKFQAAIMKVQDSLYYIKFGFSPPENDFEEIEGVLGQSATRNSIFGFSKNNVSKQQKKERKILKADGSIAFLSDKFSAINESSKGHSISLPTNLRTFGSSNRYMK